MAVLATIIVLGVLIFVHELGHFWAAKAVGIEVERFSIGLGPRVFGFKGKETEYVLSAVPLGGYVKMAGMDDEVMDRIEGGDVGGSPGSRTPRTPGPRDYDGKPIWARTLVISAGVIMNMIFAFLTYTAVAGFWGRPAVDTTRIGDVEAAYLPQGTAALATVRPGARLVTIGDRAVAHWGEVQEAFLEAPAGSTPLVLADPPGEIVIDLPADREGRERLLAAVDYWLEPTLSAVNPGSPADAAGIRAGDRILAVDGVPVGNWSDLVEAIRLRPGRETTLELVRDGEEVRVTVTPDEIQQADPVSGEYVTVGQIGVAPAVDDVVYTRLGPGEALVAGWDQTVYYTGAILGFLGDLVTGGVSPRSVGSIVTIGEASGQAANQGLDVFLSFMALFSINLAVLNLLPIPVLDGGHLVFLAIEALRGGRPLSVEQRMRWSQVGFFVIIGIMIWALSNDFMRLLGL